MTAKLHQILQTRPRLNSRQDYLKEIERLAKQQAKLQRQMQARFDYNLVLESVVVVTGVSQKQLTQGSRGKQHIADARQILSYLLRENGELLTSIGAFLGRHHATILHGINTCKDRIEFEPDFKAQIEEIRQEMERRIDRQIRRNESN